ncbi:MAG: ABC transporter ATP-binding protein, partial [Bacteroidales bacterium]|nr:ABC transporter ATP-binding protein [Bacteroidales bacterium]
MNGREKVIEVRDLVKRFGAFVANDNLSFDVYKG